ncbi:hypothetical protein DFH07DRAFT_769384, partial [Mycena maculata]
MPAAHAAHARLLSWFLDAPGAPFGVHRMALAGKAAGKDVGMWFGPSAAASAIRYFPPVIPPSSLPNAGRRGGLGVSVATDGTLYQTEVYAASHSPAALAALSSSHSQSSSHSSSHSSLGHSSTSHGKKGDKDGKKASQSWGDRPVLLLLGIWLGLDGVNPVYHETIKVGIDSFSFVPFPTPFSSLCLSYVSHLRHSSPYRTLLYRASHPQRAFAHPSRPSLLLPSFSTPSPSRSASRAAAPLRHITSSGGGLFYLDPHHSRPAVPLRPFVPSPYPLPPRSPSAHAAPAHLSTHGQAHTGHVPGRETYARGGSISPDYGYTRGGSLNPEFVGRGGSMSPERGHHAHGLGQTPMTEDELVWGPAEVAAHGSTTHTGTHVDSASATSGSQGTTRPPAGGALTPVEEAHFARAYSAAELKTFHCEHVRKMPLTGLDPSMLIGFVCRDEAEWVDLRRRVSELPRTIFSIQDEPPTWPGADDDDEMGLESVSDPEEVADADDTGFDDGD